MRRILKHPATNAAGIGAFTAFYAALCFGTAGGWWAEVFAYGGGGFWGWWGGFLAAGRQVYMAWGMIAVTALVAALLLFRRRMYDEYHTGHLLNCMAAASILSLICIAVFTLVLAANPDGFAAKYALFVAAHWVIVVGCDLVYVLASRP